MPYVISAPALCEEFPPNCPYCETRPATTVVRQRYGKMTLNRVDRAVSEKCVVELPACPDCVRWFTRSRVVLFVLGFAALLFPYIFLVLQDTVVGAAWAASIGGWVTLLL